MNDPASLSRRANISAGFRADSRDRPGREAGVLEEVVVHAADRIPGAQYAGLTLVSPARHLRTMTSTHRFPVILDEIQQRHLEGPGLTAAWLHNTVRVDDLAGDTRWPRYRREALRDTPIRSALSYRLVIPEDTLAVLSVYANATNAFDASEDIGFMLAAHATLAWDSARRDAQFRSPLPSRDVIGRAQGILMERFDMTAVAAFELLKGLSQETNTPLPRVARRLAEQRFDDMIL